METATSKKPSKILPSNAYTKLEPGEEYQPIVPAGDRRAEVTRVVGHARPDHGGGVLRRLHLHGPAGGQRHRGRHPHCHHGHLLRPARG